jgi:hypothetical protein
MADARNGRGAQFTEFAAELEPTLQRALASRQVADRLSALKGDALLDALRHEATRISGDIQQASFIRVELSSISPTLSPVTFPVAALRDMNVFTDEVFFALSKFVRPFAYGHDWVLRDAKTKTMFKSRRMLTQTPAGKPCPDTRSLKEVGIFPGMILEAVRP